MLEQIQAGSSRIPLSFRSAPHRSTQEEANRNTNKQACYQVNGNRLVWNVTVRGKTEEMERINTDADQLTQWLRCFYRWLTGGIVDDLRSFQSEEEILLMT